MHTRETAFHRNRTCLLSGGRFRIGARARLLLHGAAIGMVLLGAAPGLVNAQDIAAVQNQARETRQSVLDSINGANQDSGSWMNQAEMSSAPVSQPAANPAPVIVDAVSSEPQPDSVADAAPTDDPGSGVVVKDEVSGDAASTSGALPVADNTSNLATDSPTAYYASTGHNIAEPFLSRWQGAGGVEVLGAPLSEERYATGAGGVLQTFQNLTLVYDAGQPSPMDVHGQPLDKTMWLSYAPRDAFAPVSGCASAGCTFDSESGHTLTGPIAAFWSTWGDRVIFGRPLTEPFKDPDAAGTVAVQLFENAVLEQTADGAVRMRPLGQELASAAGLLTDPAFTAAPPSGGETYLVNTGGSGLRLRSAPDYDAPVTAVLGDNAEFTAEAGWSGAWAPGFADGLAGFVDAQYLTRQPTLPTIDPASWDPRVWQGAALSETNERAEPNTSSAIMKTLEYGDPVTVVEWVQGEEIYVGADLWAKLSDGGYVYGRNVGRTGPVAPTPLPADAPASGHWIDVDLTQQLMTAYDGQTPMHTAPITSGMAGWETPTGTFQILSRVANETMTSGAIGAENHYRLEDVLFTQYFTNQGHAIHFAWWRTPETIGRPGSHGCINILLEDARYFWNFGDIGTPVIIHY